jgi:B12-binding domain/radical SAM domain protein
MAKRNWYSMVPLINSLDASGIDVEIRPSQDILGDLKDVAGKFDRVVCCLSFYTTQRGETIELVEEIRGSRDEVMLVAGGSHATGMPEETLGMGFDAVVRGEGEAVFPGVINILLGKVNPPPGWPIIGEDPLENLDEYPPISMKYGLYPPLEISRGCLFGCSYCSVPKGFGPLRHRSPESILDAARYLLSLRGRWDFRFISPNSLGYGSLSREPNGEAIAGLLSSLRNLEGRKRIFFATFPSEARPDFVTEEILDIIEEFADNKSISIGAQSGSDEILSSINRGHDIGSVYRAAELIVGRGMEPVVDFILGLPMENESDQFQTLGAMKEVIGMGGRVRVHHFIPLAGSPLGHTKPAPIAKRVLSEIGRMALVGGASGSFTEQMRMAWEIVRWEKISSSRSTDVH